MAAPIAIVSEPPRTKFTVPFIGGRDYLEFRTREECVEKYDRLVNAPPLAGALRKARWRYYQADAHHARHVERTLRNAGASARKHSGILRMKLLVSWMQALGTYVSREFHYTMQDLVRVHGWRQLEPWVLSRHAESPKARLVELLGKVPETILFWETYDLFNAIRPALRLLGCRLGIFADDLHLRWGEASERDARLHAFFGSDNILASYAYVFDEFYPELRNRKTATWIPHAASPDFVQPFNDRPQNAILLSGFIGSLYPLRMRMKELQQQGRYAIVRHEHPGYGRSYDYENDARVGRGYARTIHRFRAGFTDALTYRYVVAKHFEIPATGALLVADGVVSEPLRQLGFVENVHYVPVSAENLEERIQYVLAEDNRAAIDEIRRRGQQLVLCAHRTCDRARLIDSVCAA